MSTNGRESRKERETASAFAPREREMYFSLLLCTFGSSFVSQRDSHEFYIPSAFSLTSTKETQKCTQKVKLDRREGKKYSRLSSRVPAVRDAMNSFPLCPVEEGIS